MGAPDWRSDVPGRPLSPENVSGSCNLARGAAARQLPELVLFQRPATRRRNSMTQQDLSRRGMLMKLGLV